MKIQSLLISWKIAGLASLALFLVACEDGATPVDPVDRPSPSAGEQSGASRVVGTREFVFPEIDFSDVNALPSEILNGSADRELTPSSVDLPVNQAIISSGLAFRITQGGTGANAWFRINNPSSERINLIATNAGGGETIRAINDGTGRGVWAQILNPSSGSTALQGTTNGTGLAVLGLTTGTGEAGLFWSTNNSSSEDALKAIAEGSGFAGSFTNLTGGPCCAERGGILGVSANSSGVQGIATGAGGRGGFFASGEGTSVPLQADKNVATGDLAIFSVDFDPKARIDGNGTGFFDGGTVTGGADVAEAFAVEGPASAYSPGDVLVISERHDRRVEKSRGAYSTRVIGVYATRPGVLLREDDATGSMGEQVPVGVVGVIPTRVTAENGPIQRGDLLVSSNRPGHAMRATERDIRHGSVLGKALETFDGPGAATIRVMVNVR